MTTMLTVLQGFAAPPTSSHMALGGRINKALLGLTEEEFVEQTKENPYF
jgi:hypothetical protein